MVLDPLGVDIGPAPPAPGPPPAVPGETPPPPPIAGNPMLLSLAVDGQELSPMALAAAPTVVTANAASATISWVTQNPCVSVLMVTDNTYGQPKKVWSDGDLGTLKSIRSVTVDLVHGTSYHFSVMLEDPSTNDPYQWPPPIGTTPQVFGFKTPALQTTVPITWRLDVSGSQQAFPGMELFVVVSPEPLSGAIGGMQSVIQTEDSSITISPPTADITAHWMYGRVPPTLSAGKHVMVGPLYGFTYTYSNAPNIKLSISPTCAPGVYTVTAPVIATVDGSSQTVSWTFTVSPLLSISRPGSIPTPPIPGLANFMAKAASEGVKYADPAKVYGFGYYGDVWFYDGSRVMLQVNDALADGNPNWIASANNIAAQYSNFVIAHNGGVFSLAAYTSGMYMLWKRGLGDTALYQQGIDTLVNGSKTMFTSYPNIHVGYQRESAINLITLVRYSQMTGARAAYLTESANIIAGHLGQLTQGGLFDQPFFDGISMEALISAYEYDGTTFAWVPSFLAWYQDWFWTHAIDTDSADATYGSAAYNVIPVNLWPACTFPNNLVMWYTGLNNLFCPVWAWLYNLTGNDTYRQRGDLLFEHTLDEPIYDGKWFSQVYTWGFDYVHYRNSAGPVKSLADPGNN